MSKETVSTAVGVVVTVKLLDITSIECECDETLSEAVAVGDRIDAVLTFEPPLGDGEVDDECDGVKVGDGVLRESDSDGDTDLVVEGEGSVADMDEPENDHRLPLAPRCENDVPSPMRSDGVTIEAIRGEVGETTVDE